MSKERIVNVKPTEYNGVNYRSTLEANTAKVLDCLGIPFSYEARRITLLESFYSSFQKDKVRAVTYTPDFIIGNIMLECKGFETPEWKIKRKYVYKYLAENEPDILFCQIYDSGRGLLEALDPHWTSLGYEVEVSSLKSKGETRTYDSVTQAFDDLGIRARNAYGKVLKCMTGRNSSAYHYEWKLNKIDNDNTEGTGPDKLAGN